MTEKYNSIYVGFVKEAADGKLAGRLKVWIPELKTREDDPKGWITCNYCSPFAGSTSWTNLSESVHNTYEKTQTSYGFWAIPPDIDNQVVVLFINGDVNKAIWIGSMFNEYIHSMVPEPQFTKKNKNKSDIELPVAEYNKYDKKSNDAKNPISPIRPWHKFKTISIGKQGLIKDKIRGSSSSSSMRESPSMVFGISTPGPLHPKYNGVRYGGHSITLDDNHINEHVTISTRSGCKIRLDETNGLIYIINKKGTGWVQIDDNGDIDVFSANDITFRSQGNLNIRADKNVSIEAGQSFLLKAAKNTDTDGNIVEDGEGVGGDIKFEALNNMSSIVKNNVSMKIEEGDHSREIVTGNDKKYVKGNIEIDVKGNISYVVDGNHSQKIQGKKSTQASSISLKSSGIVLDDSGNLQLSGNINAPNGNVFSTDFKTPSLSLVDHTHDIEAFVAPDNHGKSVQKGKSGGSTTSVSVSDVNIELDEVEKLVPINTVVKTNILKDFDGTVNISEHGNMNVPYENWWNRKEELVKTVVPKFLTFEPCKEHKKKGH